VSSESDASSDKDSGSAFDGSDASDDDDDAMSGGDESGDDWEQLEQKALKCRHFLISQMLR
jgi:nucleosome binding factor SPN SPT16 subunit